MAVQGSRQYIIAFGVLFTAWFALIHEAFFSAFSIWVGNEIYNHCLIVIPASIYLIYERRHQLNWSRAQMSWLAIFVFSGQLIFYILATAADIQLFQHVATFSMFSTLIWIFIGNSLAWRLRFPLFFVLFAVPVGEELVPFLQEITADLSVYLLEATGIPLFRSGLFIEIPQGKFLVAEACSGVSFLIASIVLGSLYANMNLVSWKRRTAFVILSIAFPILANAIRVYGIIYIGYSTDMEHAVGADHLIYGWFFFAFVLVCLFLIGEMIRRNERKSIERRSSIESDKPNKPQVNDDIKGIRISFVAFIVVIGMVALTHVQTNRMNIETPKTNTELSLQKLGLDKFTEIASSQRVLWKPKYVGNNGEKMFSILFEDATIDLFVAYFDGSDEELVSSLHRLYEQDRWTLVNRGRQKVGQHTVLRELVTSSVGVKKQILYWYVVNGTLVNSYKDAKVIQLLQTLKGLQTESYVIAVAIDVEQDEKNLQPELISFADQVIANKTITDAAKK